MPAAVRKGTIQLLCRIKPGTSASREGITAVSHEHIDMCVAARARRGDANTAVVKVLADALKIPKSDVEIVKGHKSRDKTIIVGRASSDAKLEDELAKVNTTLQESIVK
ncbi:hypothetical protein EJ04DRAFT_559874 [Polyplosphaeria fusca]|uniref:YggU-like protein n=1 Tax=Polyplosphaeria fusca TaxID=682080 RepID=A0A9P4V7G2_9PLEO|nr:hypothetical protein EJ04DRAFT_559874 [Polyplosphaeria fusca]